MSGMSGRKSRWLKVSIFAITALASAVVLSACGGGGEGGAASETETPTTVSEAAVATEAVAEDSSAAQDGQAEVDLGELEARIESAKEVPAFTFEGEQIDADAAVDGKTVMNVPWGTAVDYPVQIASAMEEAAAEVGLAYETAAVEGPDQWAQAVETAVAQDPSLISLLIVDPRAVRPQIRRALDEGTDVYSAHFWDSSQLELGDEEDLTGWTGIDYVTPARLLADWTIVDSEGSANVLIIGGPDFTFNEPVLAAMEEEFAQHCPECKYEIVNIPAVDWATKIPTTVVAAVQKNPDLSYIIPFSDPAAANVLDGLRQANAIDKVKVAAYGATPFVLDLVREGEVAFDCGYSVEWSGYAFVDQILRMLAGSEVSPDARIGLRCFDESNVSEAGVPATPGEGFGDAYRSGYEELWGTGE